MTEPAGNTTWFRSRRVARTLCILLGLSTAAWLSVRFDGHLDLTHSARASLSEPSRALLATLPGPIEVKVFAAPGHRPREAAGQLLARYTRLKSNLRVTYIDPDEAPSQLRELHIDNDGEMLVAYQERSEIVREATEVAFTNALARLARGDKRWVAVITGHGERNILGDANHDLGQFGKHLAKLGVQTQPLNLTDVAEVPSNTSLVVVTTPAVDFLASEVDALRAYLAQGGNLLWLAEPESEHSLPWLADELGLELTAGILVDPQTSLHGIDKPTIIVLSRYAPHAITNDFNLATVLPEVVGLAVTPASTWESTPLAWSSAGSWAETNLVDGTATFDGHDQRGALAVAFALERESASPTAAGRQRVVVVGDGDFLSNTYVANAGNLDFGVALVNWLTRDDQLVSIPLRSAPDRQLALSRTHALVIGLGSLFGLPGVLLLTGGVIWWKRRKR